MTAERPYFSASIEELEDLFAAGREDAPLLKKLAFELKCRKRPRARKLHAEVMAALARVCAQNAAKTDAETSAPGAHHIILEKRAASLDNLKEPARPEACPGGQPAKKGFLRRLFKT